MNRKRFRRSSSNQNKKKIQRKRDVDVFQHQKLNQITLQHRTLLLQEKVKGQKAMIKFLQNKLDQQKKKQQFYQKSFLFCLHTWKQLNKRLLKNPKLSILNTVPKSTRKDPLEEQNNNDRLYHEKEKMWNIYHLSKRALQHPTNLEIAKTINYRISDKEKQQTLLDNEKNTTLHKMMIKEKLVDLSNEKKQLTKQIQFGSSKIKKLKILKQVLFSENIQIKKFLIEEQYVIETIKSEIKHYQNELNEFNKKGDENKQAELLLGGDENAFKQNELIKKKTQYCKQKISELKEKINNMINLRNSRLLDLEEIKINNNFISNNIMKIKYELNNLNEERVFKSQKFIKLLIKFESSKFEFEQNSQNIKEYQTSIENIKLNKIQLQNSILAPMQMEKRQYNNHIQFIKKDYKSTNALILKIEKEISKGNTTFNITQKKKQYLYIILYNLILQEKKNKFEFKKNKENFFQILNKRKEISRSRRNNIHILTRILTTINIQELRNGKIQMIDQQKDWLHLFYHKDHIEEKLVDYLINIKDISKEIFDKDKQLEVYISEIKSFFQEIETIQKQIQNLNNFFSNLISEYDQKEIKLLNFQLKKIQKKEQIDLFQRENELLKQSIEDYEKFAMKIKTTFRVYYNKKNNLKTLDYYLNENIKSLNYQQIIIQNSLEKNSDLIKSKQVLNDQIQLKIKQLKENLLESYSISKNLQVKNLILKENMDIINDQIQNSFKYIQQKGTLTHKQLLEKQIKKYKKLVNCIVCGQNIKQVILTSCYHCFCSYCIEQRLVSNPRCYICNSIFNRSKIKSLYFI
ncbi:ring finger protein-related [Anaeramoeba flamelloides]|uniref:E3 ubiquitin protein ligase n=1 Tax=Anaeramoeba flamelloides TaxID=1746091 RepID=A0AAV7YV31_9EUKA|nr:ring finger protein-related [Anaeramoeba flamelloides]